MMGKLIEVMSTLPESTRVLVLEGRGAFFCSGMDLDDLIQHGKECTERMGEVFTLLTSLPCITVAKVRGGAFAGGLGLVAACDFAIATNEAIFALPELQKGLVPAFVCSLLKGQCHPRVLHEMILTGDKITAAEAASTGIINHAVADLDQASSEILQKLLKNAPQATKLFKKHFIQRDLQAAFKKAYDLHAQVLATGESKEGLSASQEKRIPKW
jgi:methylglutaconyl-CoA hydratase